MKSLLTAAASMVAATSAFWGGYGHHDFNGPNLMRQQDSGFAAVPWERDQNADRRSKPTQRTGPLAKKRLAPGIQPSPAGPEGQRGGQYWGGGDAAEADGRAQGGSYGSDSGYHNSYDYYQPATKGDIYAL